MLENIATVEYVDSEIIVLSVDEWEFEWLIDRFPLKNIKVGNRFRVNFQKMTDVDLKLTKDDPEEKNGSKNY